MTADAVIINSVNQEKIFQQVKCILNLNYKKHTLKHPQTLTDKDTYIHMDILLFGKRSRNNSDSNCKILEVRFVDFEIKT